MAVLQMQKINICAMKANRKKILELLQKRGCLEIIEKDKEDEVFTKTNTATQISIFERNVSLAENALEILDMYAPEKKSMLSSLEGKKQISDSEYLKTISDQQEIMSLVNRIIQQKKNLDEKESQIAKYQDEIKALSIWKNLDVPMNYQGTKDTVFMLGSILGSYTQEILISEIEKIEEFPKEVYIQVVAADKFQTYITCICIKDKTEETEKALRQLGFTRPQVVAHHTPAVSIKNRGKRIENLYSDIAEIKSELAREALSRQSIESVSDYYTVRADKYRVVGIPSSVKAHCFCMWIIPVKNGKVN